jgi:hypothetical protein
MGLDPSKLNPAKGSMYIPITDFASMAAYLRVGSGSIGANMEIGLDVDTVAAKIEGNAGVTAERILTTNNPVAMRSTGAMTNIVTPIGNADTLGLVFLATGDGARHHMAIPNDWDRRFPIYFRTHWMTPATAVGSRSVTWKVLYESIKAGAANWLNTLTAPPTSLDTAIAAQVPIAGDGDIWMLSPRGVIAANGLSAGTFGSDANPEFLHFAVGVSALAGWSAGTDDPRLMGLLIEYTPRWGTAHNQREAADFTV